MLRKMMFLALFGALLACSGDDDDSGDEKSDDAVEAVATIYKATSTTVEISLDGGAGAQYFVMPYTVGATSGANPVNGGADGVSNIFTVATTGGALALAGGLEATGPVEMSGRSFDYALRTAFNRFHPKNPESWAALERLEKVRVTDGPYATQYNFAGEPISKGLRSSFEQFGKKLERPRPKKVSLLQDNGCPAIGDLIGVDDPNDDKDAAELGESNIKLTSHADYCIYLASEGSVTESSLDRIKSNIETSLSLYKDVIYQDKMDKVKDDFKFQPIFIIVPYGGDYWPGTETLKISGAFSASASITHDRPTIYVGSDQGLVNSESDPKKLNLFFHSTIAHELQHAVFHYFRYVAGLTDSDFDNVLDGPQFDEGIAHYMEDVLGYGAPNFSVFPEQFLSTFPNGLNSVFPLVTGAGTAIERGASHVFFYYLVSQKGGVTFDGTVNGGDGLKFIRDYAKGSKASIEGLTAAYGGDWVDTIGNLFGALAVDGASTVIEGDKNKVQSVQAGIKNTIGDEEQSFGMRFHRHGSLGDLKDILGNFTKAGSSTDVEVTDYNTQPLLVELSADPATVTVVARKIRHELHSSLTY